MTTLKAIRRRMLDEGPADLGGHWAIASGTGTSIVVTELDESSYSSNFFNDYYALRAEAASTADRLRKITAFTNTTGAFTVATMSDTTFTSEHLEVWKYHPRLVDNAIQHALRRTRQLYTLVFAGYAGVDNWIRAASWIEQPSDVLGIGKSGRPVLTRNRYMEDWNAYDTSGNLKPDYWDVNGSGATYARADLESTLSIASRSRYGIALTRSGTDCYISQRIPLRVTGVSGDSLAGETLTAVARVWHDTASEARVRITDGTDTTNSSYHTGGSTWEELTAEHTVNSAATYIEIQVRLETSDDTIYIDEAYITHGSLGDATRRDTYHWYPVWQPTYNQSGSTLPVRLPPLGRGNTYRVHSMRPYPALDSTRLASGAADPDTIDAPEDLIAYGALAQLYRTLAERENFENSMELSLAFEFEREYVARQKLHQYNPRKRLVRPAPALAGARRW